ncbi:MAG TPA: DUF1801 domain-containing protein [Chloroflexia bacterium]|nr:DUF1801 domain-containing protein [Chloroflexia bacterium]
MIPTIDQFLEPRPPAVRDLAMRTCALVREVMPDAIGEVHPGRNNIIFGSGRKMAEWICYVSPMNSYVNLGFLRGTELPDPKGLLEGTGKLLRHVKIRSAEDLERPAVRELLAAAWAHGT